RCQRRCEMRCTQMACSPGEASAISRRESTAGSRAMAASRSSRTRAHPDRSRPGFARPRGVAVLDGRASVRRRADIGVEALLVGDLAVEDLGHEVGTQALDLVWAGLAAVEDRGLGWLHGDDLHPGLAGLEHLPHPGDRAARADAGDEDVDLAVGVLPDLLGGG